MAKVKSGLFKNPKIMTDKERRVVLEALEKRKVKIQKQIDDIQKEGFKKLLNKKK